MARIRTIKPEFPQSETIGKLSRDARLLFIQIWTICDDLGRARGNSRILASLLYPYDDDAKALLPGWLGELEDIGAIRLYLVDGDTYLEVCNWLKHQKIDKPSGPKCPGFEEGSPKPREASQWDPDPDPDPDPDRNPPLPPEGGGSTGNRKGRAKPKATEFVPDDVPGLNLGAWIQLVNYRADRKPAIKPCSMHAMARKLAAFGNQQQAVVDNTIANGYQGLIPPIEHDGAKNGTSQPSYRKSAVERVREATECDLREILGAPPSRVVGTG